jgi:hypothetical protein
MITAMSLTNGTLTVIFDNGSEILTARNDHPQWEQLVDAYKDGNETYLKKLLSMKSVVEDYSVGALSINSTGVTYHGKPLNTVDADRVLAFLREGLPYKPIANYINRKMANPSARAIQEMYSFLEHKGMPLTNDGTFIAYKGVENDFWSVTGNTITVVKQGTVDSGGRILNTIGSIIEVERSSVNDDFRQGCSFGLHAGSLNYARGWGKRVVLVEIDPADVVSVPEDCNCQKLRCCKYKVIGEYTGPMPDHYTSEFDAETVDAQTDECPNCGELDCYEDCYEDSDSDTCSYCGMDTCDGNCACVDDHCKCESLECSDCNPSAPSSIERGQLVSEVVASMEALINEGNPNTEEAYLDGLTAGINDRDDVANPKYILSDREGADSPSHARYIEGYVHGYAS